MSPLQQYNYEIRYKPGKSILLASCLSRALMKDCDLSPAIEAVERIHTNYFLSVADHLLSEAQREREREICDPIYRGLKTQSWMASLLQKVISQQPFIQATPEEPQTPPLADATILPKQLDRATVAIPSKAQSL